jgi:predicted DsbA family dithiol-disulfide isomerase
LEAAHRSFTVLPCRFGTVAPDAATLSSCISANRARFHEALHGIDGRVELGIRAAWKGGQMFASLAEHDAAIRRLNARVKGRSEMETYYERIELGRHVETGLAALRGAETARLTAELTAIAERVTELPIHEDADIFNHAYLVPRAREAEFDAAVARLAERGAARLDLRYVGPMPPFNFVTMHAGWLAAGAGKAA